MRKVLSIFVLMLFHSFAFAQELTCLDKLLPYSRYTGYHHLTKAEWSDGKDHLDSVSAMAALNSLTGAKLLCRSHEVVVKIAPVCQPVIADLPQSNVCYLFTNLGYFFISKDNGRNVNFVFSKDKMFDSSINN